MHLTNIILPRLPLDGRLDLTYRCNNNCRHCWLWVHPDGHEKKDELSFNELRNIVDQARAMGCQAWSISGGEPMLRPDFSEIFDYITQKSIVYSLNTNGTLITPEIAKLLTRQGKKMVALYGATAEIHDNVTRNPGSFEATMRGFAYLKEASAGFTVQVIPMRANFHQYKEMLTLAESLSSDYRVGASWLYLSACHSSERNREIMKQRLDPLTTLLLDQPLPFMELKAELDNERLLTETSFCVTNRTDDCLFAACIEKRRDFHIDPYGQMSFCSFIKDPALRYDLRKGSFQEAWDTFIPSLAGIVRGGREYQDNCGSCDLRSDCHWCAVYSYLENGRYSAKVDYLCQIAAETRRFKEDWKSTHLRYYQIAGITIQLTTEFEMTNETFDPKFEKFRVDGPGEDTISLRLVASVPTLKDLKLGVEIYRRPPWAIYRQRDSWVYLGISPNIDNQKLYNVSIFNDDYSHATIFNHINKSKISHLGALTSHITDQILLTSVLANREACYFHSSAFIMDGHGLLFVGHSEAGKSTMIKILRGHGEILCDERNIVRKWPEGFRVHGTWSHGELPDVSPASAPLRAIFFLEQADFNELIPITYKREKLGKLLSHVIKGLVTEEWWDKILALVGKISTDVPIYRLRFNKSGEVVDVLKHFLSSN